MAIQQHVRKVGAHSRQETRPCDPASSKPTVAPDSQPPPATRKRKRGVPSPEHHTTQSTSSNRSSPQSKRQKTSSNSSLNSSTCTSSTGFSWSSWARAETEYWDSLPRIYLTSDCLREHNRRNKLLLVEDPSNEGIKINFEQHPRDITRFARHGGPDLSDIRNIPSPFSEDSAFTASMPRKGKGKGKENDRRSSAYDGNFEQHLIENSIYPVSREHRAANHEVWTNALTKPRSSPSHSSDASYNSFVREVGKAQDEGEIMAKVFPKIVGKTKHATACNVPFRHLNQITKRIVVPQPDLYQGEVPDVGNRTIRANLDKDIVPSTRKTRPFLPNYFAEVKGPEGSYAVAERQACHGGAVGARAMHRLQSLGGTEDYDGKAYTASATYYGRGYMDLHTHHMTQPRGPGTLPHTHMTPLQGYNLTNSPQSFREGRNAFRNVADKAHDYRVEFIKDANRRNRIISPPPPTRPTRSNRKPLSFQAAEVEQSDSESDTSEAEDSDDDDQGEVRRPNIVNASPRRAAKKIAPKGPSLGRRKHVSSSSDSESGSESDYEPATSRSRGRQTQKAEVVAISPARTSRRVSSQRRILRPRN